MKGLRNKLKDQSGASILLALLFFLLCSMVGSSVLMAAVSNAGKVRSNREEQQKYLLLSSALRLVCDELTSAEYYGAYTVNTVTVPVPAVTDADGNVISPAYSYTYKVYQQTVGSFFCGLSDVAPLLPELDRLFARTFPSSGSGDSAGDDIYKPLPDSQTSELKTHELTLIVNTSEVEGLNDPEDIVTVKVELDQNLSIRLTATLGVEKDGYIYTMKAQLIGQGNLGLAAAEGGNQTGPVRWTLAWITQKEAGEEDEKGAGDGA